MLVNMLLKNCPLYRSFPESPRWLLACGKFEKAKTILLKIGKVNGKHISPEYMDQLKVGALSIYKFVYKKSIHNRTFKLLYLVKVRRRIQESKK